MSTARAGVLEEEQRSTREQSTKRAEFEEQLKSDGYSQIETKDYAARPANEAHGHDFAVRGLVLEGAFTVIQGNQSVTYLPGPVFTVAVGIPHSEEIGSQGSRVLVGRKI